MGSSLQETQTNTELQQERGTLLLRSDASVESKVDKKQAEYRLYGAVGRLAHILTDIAQSSAITNESGKSDASGIE